MATYAIGDVQGCFDELKALLRKCDYRKATDRLWFVGDLVNRGPKSLEVLRFVRDLGAGAVVVLGNHDLHLVTQHEGFERQRKDDTFQDVLEAKDAAELVDWLRTRPMLHAADGYAMVHAGLLPQWSIDKAIRQRSRNGVGRGELHAIPKAHVRQQAGGLERFALRLGPAAGHRQRDDPNALLHA
jgi:bis(5'-nucleosyl)-tetraphosphatase (symmetrical)